MVLFYDAGVYAIDGKQHRAEWQCRIEFQVDIQFPHFYQCLPPKISL